MKELNTNKEEIKSFCYKRGRFIIIGSTEKDRNSARIDIILSWSFKIIVATTSLVLALSKILL